MDTIIPVQEDQTDEVSAMLSAVKLIQTAVDELQDVLNQPSLVGTDIPLLVKGDIYYSMDSDYHTIVDGLMMHEWCYRYVIESKNLVKLESFEIGNEEI